MNTIVISTNTSYKVIKYIYIYITCGKLALKKIYIILAVHFFLSKGRLLPTSDLNTEARRLLYYIEIAEYKFVILHVCL